MPVKTCEICGRKFAGHGLAKYCIACRDVAEQLWHKRYYQRNRERLLSKRKTRRKQSKTCELCGASFEGHGNTKYCPECKVKAHRARSHRWWCKSQKCVQAKRAQHCARCGKEFDVKNNAKYCPDCRPVVYREKQREYNRRYYAKHCGGKVTSPKPKADPKKARLAYLRKRLEEAQTAKTRSRYFRQYVLLNQELSRGG